MRASSIPASPSSRPKVSGSPTSGVRTDVFDGAFDPFLGDGMEEAVQDRPIGGPEFFAVSESACRAERCPARPAVLRGDAGAVDPPLSGKSPQPAVARVGRSTR